MIRSRRSFLPALALVCVALFALSCQSEKKDPTDSPNPKLATVDLKIGPTTIKAEVAATDIQRERGLMFRTRLADGEGMIFLFDKDQQLSFWMKNTKLPLSIAFISSTGQIRQLADMEAESLATTLSDYSVRYALEVPKGWFARAGVKVGDSMDLSPLPR